MKLIYDLICMFWSCVLIKRDEKLQLSFDKHGKYEALAFMMNFIIMLGFNKVFGIVLIIIDVVTTVLSVLLLHYWGIDFDDDRNVDDCVDDYLGYFIRR